MRGSGRVSGKERGNDRVRGRRGSGRVKGKG